MYLSQEEIVQEAKRIKIEPAHIKSDLHDGFLFGKDVTVDINVWMDDWAQKNSYLPAATTPGVHLSVHDYKMSGTFRSYLYDHNEPPMVDFTSCVVCRDTVMPASCLTDRNGKDYLTIGLCPTCGFIQQSRRPPREWYANFYRKMWDPERRDPSAWPDPKDVDPSILGTFQGFLRPGMKVLEIGTGYGRNLAPFQAMGLQCFGIEAGEHRAEFVRTKRGIPVFTGEAEKAPIGQDFFQTGSFDIIFSNHVLEHVYDTREVIEHLYPLLKPNGLALLSLPIHYQENLTQLTHDMSHTCSFSHANFLYMLQTIGFDYVRDYSSPDNLAILVRKSTPIDQNLRADRLAWMKSFLPTRLLAFLLEKNGLSRIPADLKFDLSAHMKWFLGQNGQNEPFLQMKYSFVHQCSKALDALRAGIRAGVDVRTLGIHLPVRYVYPTVDAMPIWYY